MVRFSISPIRAPPRDRTTTCGGPRGDPIVACRCSAMGWWCGEVACHSQSEIVGIVGVCVWRDSNSMFNCDWTRQRKTPATAAPTAALTCSSPPAPSVAQPAPTPPATQPTSATAPARAVRRCTPPLVLPAAAACPVAALDSVAERGQPDPAAPVAPPMNPS